MEYRKISALSVITAFVFILLSQKFCGADDGMKQIVRSPQAPAFSQTLASLQSAKTVSNQAQMTRSLSGMNYSKITLPVIPQVNLKPIKAPAIMAPPSLPKILPKKQFSR